MENEQELFLQYWNREIVQLQLHAHIILYSLITVSVSTLGELGFLSWAHIHSQYEKAFIEEASSKFNTRKFQALIQKNCVRSEGPVTAVEMRTRDLSQYRKSNDHGERMMLFSYVVVSLLLLFLFKSAWSMWHIIK